MKQFIASDINDLYKLVSKDLLNFGVERETRGLKTKEIEQEVCLVLTNPKNSVLTLRERHQDERVYKYLEGEFKWFLSGELALDKIRPYARFWEKIVNPDDTINSNYGYYTFFQPTPEKGVSQFDWCVKRLKNDLFSRQAIININQPRHKFFNNKDFCCTIGQHFLYRNGALDSVVWMRSNDFIFGTTYNFPWFTHVQQMVAEAVGVPVGRYVHMVSTLHVYEPHYEMVKAMAADKTIAVQDLNYQERNSFIKTLWEEFRNGKTDSFWEKAWKNRL